AITLRFRHAEIAKDLFLRIAAFLMADHHARFAAEPGEPPDDRGIVSESTVAVQLFEALENTVRVIEGVGALRMTRDLRNLPSAQFAVDVACQALALFLQ